MSVFEGVLNPFRSACLVSRASPPAAEAAERRSAAAEGETQR
jgi:hypothetical protein